MSQFQLTSPLILAADPTTPLEASTKQYVDGKLVNLPAESLTIGTIPVARLPALNGQVTSEVGSGVVTLSDTGVIEGSYATVTVSGRGRVMSGVSGLTADQIQDVSWNKITSGKPTTVAGYGITDVIGSEGGTVSGNLSLTDAPTADLHLANVEYLQSSLANATIGQLTTGDVIRKTMSSAEGFLRCNGGFVSKVIYNALYNVIGSSEAVSYFGSGQPWRQQYEFNTTQTTDITGWGTGTSLPGSLFYSQAVVTKNRVYLLGGGSASNYVSTVYTAPINSDGTLGAWTTGTSLPGPLAYSQAVVTKNRIYLMGGHNNSDYVSTVYTAPINSDGTVGEWGTATSLPGPLFSSQAVVTKNRVYLLGGTNGASFLSTTYTAPINEDGTLGTWATGTSLPGPLGHARAVVTKNRVYLLGGHNGSNYVSTVYTAPINYDGTLGDWSTGTSLPGPLAYSQAVVTKSRVYLLGGLGGSGFSSAVYTAPVNEDGTLGTWTTGTSLASSLAYSQVIVTKNRIYLMSGHNGSAFVPTVYTAAFSGGFSDYSFAYNPTSISLGGAGKPWKNQYEINTTQSADIADWTVGTTLPTLLQFSQAVVTKNRVYLLGGMNSNSPSNAVLTAPINTDGTLGTWASGTSLPATVFSSQAVATKNRVYLLGGVVAGSPSSAVYTAPINEDGTLGAWSTGTPLPSSFSSTQAVIVKNRIYLLGGYDGTQRDTVYVAPINEDGTLGTWTQGAPLSDTVHSAQAVVTKSRIYLLGGVVNGSQSVAIRTAPINDDGTLGAWSTDTTLPATVISSQALTTTNRVYLIGGYVGSVASGAVFSAPIDNDGTLGTWSSGTALPMTATAGQLVVTKNHVHLLGGMFNDTLYGRVLTASIQGGDNDYSGFYRPTSTTIPGAGQPWKQQYEINNTQTTNLTSWSQDTSTKAPMRNAQVLVTKSKIYIFGGTNGSIRYPLSYSAPIDQYGTIGVWTEEGNLPVGVADGQVIVTKNRVHLLGGFTDAGYSTTVYTAPIGTDGSVGTWTTASSLPTALSRSHVVVTKNKVYLIGGETSNGVSNAVYMTYINTDGTLGTWSTVTAFPTPLLHSQAMVGKDRVYVFGGYDGTNYLSTIYTASIGLDGTIGAWTTTTTGLPTTLGRHQAVMVRNKVYLFGGDDGSGLRKTVFNAAVNADGTIGTWGSHEALPAGFAESAVAITSAKLYLLGGYRGSAYVSAAYSVAFTGGFNDYPVYYSGTFETSDTFRLPDYSSQEVDGLYRMIKT